MLLDYLPMLNVIIIAIFIAMIWLQESFLKSLPYLAGTVLCLVCSYYGHTFKFPSQMTIVLIFLFIGFFMHVLLFFEPSSWREIRIEGTKTMPYFILTVNFLVYLFYIVTGYGMQAIMGILTLLAISLIPLLILKLLSRHFLAGYLYVPVVFLILTVMQCFELGFGRMFNSIIWGMLVSFAFYSITFLIGRKDVLFKAKTSVLTIWLFTNMLFYLWNLLYQPDIAFGAGRYSNATLFDSTDYVRVALLFGLMGYISGRSTVKK